MLPRPSAPHACCGNQALTQLLSPSFSSSHPQASQFVARLEGLYEDDENAYLVSELCGATVRGLLDERGGRLDEADAAVVMRGVLDVLVESHQRGVAYGDVKVRPHVACVGAGDGGRSPRCMSGAVVACGLLPCLPP